MIASLFPRAGACALAAFLLLGTAPRDRAAAAEGPFADFPGSWTGDGTITLADGHKERLRCRASYRVDSVSASDLELMLACSSDSYRFEFSGAARAGSNGDISGRWSENTRNVAGNLSGRARGNRIQVAVESPAFSADIGLTTKGRSQSVSVRSRGNGEQISASISLTRR